MGNSAKQKQVAIVVGASRGIGRQVAIDLAKAGYAVVVAAKTRSDAAQCTPFPPDPNSSASTIDTVAREITELYAGEALPVRVDVRQFGDIKALVERAMQAFGRVDVAVYNSGAIWWASVAQTPMSRFQLMQRVNVEGLYGFVQAVLPCMYRNGRDGKGEGRIVVVSPPVYSRFVRGKTAYAMGKWGMSALTMGLAVDFEREGRERMAVTSLWPAVAIESAATTRTEEGRANLRLPTIFSEAVLSILRAPAGDVSGKTFLDEDYLREHDGLKEFGRFAVVEGARPRRIMPVRLPDLRVAEQDDEGVRVDSTVGREKL